MNIITNDCTGGTIYKELLKEEYKNPFIWSRIYANDFITLIKNYYDVNFNNFQLLKHSQNFDIKNDFYLRIDNKFNVNFRHYFLSDNTKVIKKDPNIFYNKIWEFIVEKYELRIVRMVEKPIIFINEREDFNKENIEQIINLCENKFKLFIWTNYIEEINTEKLIVKKHNLNVDSPWEYVKRDKNTILKFLM